VSEASATSVRGLELLVSEASATSV
jgi:hypothetical protein